MCESVTNNGNTCVNPQIIYGTTTGGIPKKHGNMDTNMKTWCQQLGGVYVSHTLGPRSGFALFPCNKFDETVWHWCDWRDGRWYNSALNQPITSDKGAITGITCNPSNVQINVIPEKPVSNGMFTKCVPFVKNQWCKQNGPTKPQYTMCESVTNNGNTCLNPQIRYGTTTGGIPTKRERNSNMDTDMKTWCQQLGGVYVSHTYGPRSGFAVAPCKGHGESRWHWCDVKDGYWYNVAPQCIEGYQNPQRFD